MARLSHGPTHIFYVRQISCGSVCTSCRGRAVAGAATKLQKLGLCFTRTRRWRQTSESGSSWRGVGCNARQSASTTEPRGIGETSSFGSWETIEASRHVASSEYRVSTQADTAGVTKGKSINLVSVPLSKTLRYIRTPCSLLCISRTVFMSISTSRVTNIRSSDSPSSADSNLTAPLWMACS